MNKKNFTKGSGIAVLAAAVALATAAPAVCSAGANAQIMAKAAEEDKKAEGMSLKTKTYEHEYKFKDGKVYEKLSFKYPAAEGDSEAAKTFNDYYKKLLKKWKKAAKENLADAKELVLQREDDVFYSDEVTCEIMQNDENYVSVLLSGYSYEFGAHGMPYRYADIFDAKTGKKLSAAKLLGLTKKQLNEKVRGLYLEQFDKDPESGFYPDRKDVETALNETDFNKNLYYLKDDKIYFYADPYLVGPYAAGFIEVSVDLEETA